VEITRDGKPVAVLMPIEQYNRLIAGNSSFWKSLEKFYQEIDFEKSRFQRKFFREFEIQAQVAR
jgi:hypothetical protein